MTVKAMDCKRCDGLCCKYFCFEIDEPDDYDEFEDVRWYLCHEGVSVHIDEDGDWYIQIMNPCLKLDEENRCTIYDDRPLICRTYGEECEATGNDYCYQEEFTTPEQLDDYARKTLGPEEYDKEMLKRRAKLDGVSRKEMRSKLISIGRLQPSGKAKKDKPKGKGRKGKASS